MISALAIGQEIMGSNPNLGMDVCSGSDTTLNGGRGLFRSRVRKMAVSAVTNNHIFIYEWNI